MAKKGERRTIDLTIQDIVGHGIGLLPGWATASHFAKYGQSENEAKPEDLARGIFSLCSGVIASSLVFVTRSFSIKTIILGGRLVKFDLIFDYIKKIATLFEIDVYIVEHPETMVAVGSGI